MIYFIEKAGFDRVGAHLINDRLYSHDWGGGEKIGGAPPPGRRHSGLSVGGGGDFGLRGEPFEDPKGTDRIDSQVKKLAP